MRLASADRRSIVKWLWAAFGVLAWVVLASIFGASQASAEEPSDAAASASATTSADDNRGATPVDKPNNAKPNAQPATNAKPAAATSSSRPDNATAKPSTTTSTPSTPQHAGKPGENGSSASPAKPDTAAKPSTPAKPDTPARPVAPKPTSQPDTPKTTPDWAGVPGASAPASDASAAEKPKTTNPPGHANKPDASTPHAPGNTDHPGNGNGNAYGHDRIGDENSLSVSADARTSVASASHGIRFARTAHPLARTTHAGPAEVVPESAAAAHHAPAHAPQPLNAPGVDAAPATSGAGASGATPLQVTGDAAAGHSALTRILLGVRAHADDRAPSGPAGSTDCSPD